MTSRTPSEANPRIKRIHEPSVPSDGARILVERLWPRGISKQRADLRLWMKDIAPSPALRTWYGHEVAKWTTFRSRYIEELRLNQALLRQLREYMLAGPVTLVFAAADAEHSSARVLRDVLVDGGQA
jgi:uncharacterized protein YeaO (DUF488 family)